jgi:hypothetical protein
MTNVYPKSSVEMIAMPITNNGVVVTVGVTYSIVKEVPGVTTVEGTHVAADILNGKTGRIINGLTPGIYKVWGAVTSASPETPHIFIGTFRISE